MKNYLIWLIAIIITLSAVVYQRATGPTYPKKVNFIYNGTTYKSKLNRSQTRGEDCKIILNTGNENFTANLKFRKYPATENQEWESIEMVKESTFLQAILPELPPAGKYEYFIEIYGDNLEQKIPEQNAVVLRFKDPVPAIALIPHVIFMFAAMLLSNVAALMAAFKKEKYRLYSWLTFSTLLLGGMILGPVVQKFSFGDFWTGIPFGWDLTDNKTLIAFLFWLIAIVTNIKKQNYLTIIIAAIVLFVIFLIPHSMFGSELDHSTGKIIQGCIQIWLLP